MNRAPAPDKNTPWLTLGAASRFLGVDAGTLRAWTDARRVRAFRTPGGHRRYARQDLEAFLQEGRAERGDRVSEVIGPHGVRLMPGPSRRNIREQSWYATVDPQAVEGMRLTCRRLMESLAAYLGGGRRQADHLRAGEDAGRELGAEVAMLRLTPSQATEAFLYFKESITDAVSTRMPLSPDDKVRSIRRIEQFLDHVLLQMMTAYEQRAGSAS